MSVKYAWCLRFNEKSEHNWNCTEADFERTEKRGVIKCEQGIASLKAPDTATGIYCEITPGLCKRIKTVWVYKKDQFQLQFRRQGEDKKEFPVY